MVENGFLISFSGIDGSGKSTLINCLKEYLNKIGILNVSICDAAKPCVYNNKINSIAQSLNGNMFNVFGTDLVNFCYAIDYIKNLEYQVIPALVNGDIVIMHRNEMCCKAYSMAYNCNMRILNRILSSFPRPDLHFYLDIDPGISIERLNKRRKTTGETPTYKENYDTLTKVRNNYFSLIQNEYSSVQIVDASLDVIEVNNIIQNKVNTLLKLGVENK